MSMGREKYGVGKMVRKSLRRFVRVIVLCQIKSCESHNGGKAADGKKRARRTEAGKSRAVVQYKRKNSSGF